MSMEATGNSSPPLDPIPTDSHSQSYLIKNMEVPIVHDKLYLCKQFQPSHCQELHDAAQVASCLNRWNQICDQYTQQLIQKASGQ